MALQSNILKFFISKLGNRYNEDEINSFLFLSLFSYFAFLFFFILGIICLIDKHYFIFAINVLSIIPFQINLWLSKKKFYKNFALYIFLIFTQVLTLFLLIFPLYQAVGILYLIIPVISILLFGARRGNIISLVFVPVSILAFFVPYVFNLEHKFPVVAIFILILAYIAFHFIIYSFKLYNESELQDLKNDLREAKKLNLQKDEFLSKLSHQLRTPLNNITIITNLLNNSDLDPRQKDLIDTIQASANNLGNVINNISEISAVEIVENADYTIVFDLYPTIQNTFELLSKQEQQNVKFNLTVPEEVKYNLKGNPVRIKQVFLNLFEVILKYRETSDISINIVVNIINKTNDTVKLSFEIVSNQPIKLTDERPQRQVFPVFFNPRESKTQEIIQLLDLSIANKIIEQHGEKLKIDNLDDSTLYSFSFSFGLGQKIKPETIAKSSLEVIEKSLVELKDSNVLLVEDNVINQKIVILSLKKSVKNIDIANNGKEALDKFGTSKYDVILMDIQMPVMNGIVTTKKIREIESATSSHTPIIAITANALLGDKENCLAAGMDDYIAKPFQIELLLKKMKNQLEKVK